MDPASAIGAASSVITFIEVGYKFVALVYSLDKHGANDNYEEVDVIWKRMQQCSLDILEETRNPPHPTTDAPAIDTSICELAEECYKLSVKLGVKIVDARPKTQKLRDLFKAALKDLLSGDEIKQLQRRLDSCCGQLHLYLSIRNRQEIGDQIRSEIGNILTRMQNASEDCAQTVQRARELSNQRNILSALRFNVLDQRFLEVATAAENTYSWILGDHIHDQDLSDDPPKLELLQQFKEWLSEGSGIFHISGKPGAGKSTLMKYLCENENTYDKLREWAGDENKLVLGKFFFWRAGSPLQKSLSGLKRALLFDILKQCPEFVQDVFPKHWDPSNYQPGIQPPLLTIENKEISEGLKELFCNATMYKGRRLAIFIDGLDEFEEDSHSYHDLLNEIMQWLENSGGRLKLCVSSREDRVFMERLSAKQRIRLHELNATDILAFIKQGLLANPNFQALQEKQPVECASLISELVGKSEGVFLWVTVAIRNVIEALECHESLSTIRKKVDLLPRKLQDLFTSILMSIPESQRNESCCTLSYALVAARLTATMQPKPSFSPSANSSLFQLSFLDEYMSDSNTLLKRSGPMTEEEIEERSSKAAVQMLARSKSLLTIKTDNRGRGCFYFIHRSIPEFLDQFLLPGSQAHRYLVDSHGRFDSLAAYLGTLRDAIKFSSYRLGDEIVLPAVTYTLQHLTTLTQDLPTYFGDLEAIEAALLKKYQHQQDTHESIWGHGPAQILAYCPLYMATTYEIAGYVLWKVRRHPHLLTGPEGFYLAASVLGSRDHIRGEISVFFFYCDFTGLYLDNHPKSLRRLELMNDLINLGLDLNSRVPGVEITMWAVIANYLIQRPHALVWRVVNLGLQHGLPEPSWEWSNDGRTVEVFIGEHSYKIFQRGVGHFTLPPPKGKPLIQTDGVPLSLRDFLTCDSGDCTCIIPGAGTDVEADTGVEKEEEEKEEPTNRLILLPGLQSACWHPDKKDREGILKILDERQATTTTADHHHPPRDEEVTSQTTPAISWAAWISTPPHDIIPFPSFLNQLRKILPPSINPASLPWLLVTLLLLPKLRYSTKTTTNLISRFNPLPIMWLLLTRLSGLRKNGSKSSTNG
ncbi:hypothetical protein QBC41DRAFT_321772 [Cercophora samala]|uniref:Nephrocystin 3-like N-terminal domain-containing protein n=1 Tax=Cercophora samala TaxID=330535 RepID=A0AA39ZCU7_9PEZI|nr:hypothetical protein QBC41DRAFT_321772 [Cercophora samala]